MGPYPPTAALVSLREQRGHVPTGIPTAAAVKSALVALAVASRLPVSAMTSGDALRLTRAWSHGSRGGADLPGVSAQPSGEFEVAVRGTFLSQDAETPT